MSITGRQNNLFLAEDWKKIYQSFKNSNFASYDFENLRRVMIAYLRENYPEDFNDYIESSEYIALIDLIAFLGQSLAFRIDLNARENFLELAERRESILRLAQLISYNPKRSICGSGLLKVESISTTEMIIDSTGRNLQNIEVVWNDITNTNWFDQFIKIVNASMVENMEFGLPGPSDWVDGIWSEQYKINSVINDLPIFPFSKTIDGKSFSFETTSTVISKDQITGYSTIQEDTPLHGNSVSFIYRDDLSGYGSNNTGFFFHFRQGDLHTQDFTLTTPTTNQIVSISDKNINNDDVWLYSLSNTDIENSSNLWTKVSAITGNNIIYNSISKTIKNIYSVQTSTDDSVNLIFADGIFGNLPKGSFRCYYRTSNGISYTINPKDMRGIVISIPYTSATGSLETIRFVASLKSSVTNATAAETNDEIRLRAPSTYYTQNRMITGEDYNLAPLSVSQNIAKIKSINRTSSGISRNFDIVDATGNYSTTSTFCTDGIIYREPIQNQLEFKFNSRTDIESIITNKIEPITKTPMIRDFYYRYYNKTNLSNPYPIFTQVTSSYNESTGYLKNNIGTVIKIGSFTGDTVKYIEPGALVKFTAPTGKSFKKGKLVTTVPTDPDQTDFIWTKVVSVVGDGTANALGILPTKIGPLVFNVNIPTGSLVSQIIPKFLGYIPTDIQSLMMDLIFNYKNFGLRYDITTRTWNIIQQRNLNLYESWNYSASGDNSGTNQDKSWIFAFETNGEKYTVTYRGLEYYFESIKENRFFFDGTRKVYDSSTGKVQKDKVSILKVNPKPNTLYGLGADYPWQIIGNTIENDGYISSKAVKITFWDDNDDNIVDNPEAFDIVVNPTATVNVNGKDYLKNFIFFEKYTTNNYVEDYRYVSNETDMFIIRDSENSVTDLSSYTDGQLFYFYESDTVKKFNKASMKLTVTLDYYAVIGRQGIYFHYLHNAESTTRIDPSSTNIIDLYLLTKDYDTTYRQYLSGAIESAPLPPSSTSLRLTYGKNLENIKSVSDDLIYHPVNYKVLFGSTADPKLQASFKVVKNNEQVITDNDIKTRIIISINEFFRLDNWDFGDTFYFTELSTYVMNKVSPFITTFVIVPTNSHQVYGSLQQITSSPNEIFISGATVSDIEIIPAITASRLKTSGYIVTTSLSEVNTTSIQSSTNY
jgi:hypothetical protein